MIRNAALPGASAVPGRSPCPGTPARRRPGWRTGARSVCAVAVASTPLLASLGACDVTLSATASIDQACQIDHDCPSGQRCLATTPNRWTCEVAVDAAAENGADATVDAAVDGGDATLANVEGSQAETGATPSTGDGGVGEVVAPSQVDAQDAGDADAQDAGELDASDADAEDAGDADADADDTDANGLCKPIVSPSTLVLFGGSGSTMDFRDTWLWDGAAWSSVDAGDAAGPPSRSAAAMTTACGYAVLVGGYGPAPSDGGSPIKSDAWLWDGSRWQPAPSAPAARFAGAAATLGSTLYLFGGQGPGGIDAKESGLLAWDGGAWSTPPQSSLSGPPPRAYPVVVTVAGGLLVFGGEDNAGDVLPDTWLLTGTSWQLLDDGGADSGPALQAAGAASVGGSVVMFGGLDESFDTLGDTWLWDGGAWSMVPAQADSPPPRAYPVMGALNGRLVLFGGVDANNVPLGDTWFWDGGSWVRGPDAGPPPRQGAAMTAY